VLLEFIKFERRNLADLGEDIRNIQPTGKMTIDRNDGNAPNKSREC